MTLKKVIIVALILMFLVPLFDTELYIETPYSWNFILKNTKSLLENNSIPTATITSFLQLAVDSHQIGESEN